MKILIVEDEIRIREGIEKLLSKLDQEFEIVGEAEDGEDGLQIIREKHPDMVITDIRMPGMDGLEMLSRIAAEGLGTKAIVLSAYSEFEYARKAMKMGVTEYLLKPIAFHEFAQAIENVKQQIEKEKQEKPDQIGTKEQIFHTLIAGRMAVDEQVSVYLENNYQIQDKQPFFIVYAYLGTEYETALEKTKIYFQHTLSLYARNMTLTYCILEERHRNSLIILLYHYQNVQDLERWIQRQILNQSAGKMSIGCVEIAGIEHLKEGLDRLYPYMDWNISLGNQVMISYPKVTNIQTSSCVYPMELETKAKLAICSSDWEQMERVLREFHESFQDGEIYEPREIKECYVRFLWTIIGIAKEMGCLEHSGLEQNQLLERIMGAKIREELIEAADMLFAEIRQDQEEETITHLTVKRVKSLIHEFYQSGITLDEIGVKLNLTPEYLGTLFHKEIGMTFSNYMKNYRIGKARELLCGTQLKLYEIAQQVGYADPKYFSKVFKEVTGQLPGEYRKTYK
jgi:two-component system response regulator YesN